MPRLTIQAGFPIEEILSGFEDNRSGRLNSVAERYSAIVADEAGRLGLGAGEWAACFDALQGAEVEGHDSREWKLAWASVADLPAAVAAAHRVDPAALSAKLQRLPLAARAAVWELAARYWANGAQVPPVAFLATQGVTPARAA